MEIALAKASMVDDLQNKNQELMKQIDICQVIWICLQVLLTHCCIINLPLFLVHFSDYADFSIRRKIRYWINFIAKRLPKLKNLAKPYES